MIFANNFVALLNECEPGQLGCIFVFQSSVVAITLEGTDEAYWLFMSSLQ